MTSHHSRLAAMLLLGFALACGAGNRERDEPCEDSDACARGLTCAAGACRAPCNVGTDCPEGTGCAGGLCMPLGAGTCGQAADCRTPPDACHVVSGARCLLGRCEYNRAATTACREECDTVTSCDEPTACEELATARCVDTGCVYDPRPNATACANGASPGVCYNGRCVDCLDSADCDPRAFGYDLCYAATCVNRSCTFAEIASCDLDPLGSLCSAGESCRTGWCADGRCCESPCDGVCADCGSDGRCGVDVRGSVCEPDPPAGEDEGRCDGMTPECRRLIGLSVMPFAVRYFLEEASTGTNRQDFFDNLPLAASGSMGITRVQSSTGDGVAWTSTGSAYIYCATLGTTDFAQTQMLLTFEAVITIGAGADLPDSTIMFMGPSTTAARAELGVTRAPNDPPGQVKFHGYFGDGTAEYTWLATIGSRAVIHLVFDGYQAATSNVMRLFVDGVEMPRLSAGSAPASLELVDSDVLCIGNDLVPSSGAFAGSLWYAAVYDEDMTPSEIADAAIRLGISDE